VIFSFAPRLDQALLIVRAEPAAQRSSHYDTSPSPVCSRASVYLPGLCEIDDDHSLIDSMFLFCSQA